ncbi:kynurenine/alpha-aminoadipate aminotransferase [Gonapodya prolifera JEL478]|uniref:Kynurenine/alpha-aminoadipate aminotransferase n=1 Tax=Gonapodya prolifera (strain JEL478) TaxID=1344416 RepID=A0A139A5F2_GONPJ|nr:kynurenine/alpha-aminoadipate aminotransferase [Gonapodya prolifera JEL478]|eukprot:KXS11878.1 kynurenine/alpha-aminoadipate aminotransferase [Gonapodya prolifera JEL478]
MKGAIASAAKLPRDQQQHLAGGKPNPTTFPIVDVELKMRDGAIVAIGQEATTVANDYGMPFGYPPLREWCHEFTSIAQSVPKTTFETSVAAGSLGTMFLAFDLFVDRGDCVLCDAPTFTGALTPLRTIGAVPVDVATDGDGVIPEALEAVLSGWDEAKSGKRPRVFYTVPTGGNPTGISTIAERKAKVLEICGKYEVLILEDDPYYFLQFTPELVQSYFSLAHAAPPTPCPPVLRFDSFAKLLSAGARVSWLSGPKELVALFDCFTMGTIGHGSIFAQAALNAVVRNMGFDGFLAHTREVCAFYKKRRDVVLGLAQKYLSATCEWKDPMAGMFLWLKVTGETVVDVTNLVVDKMLPVGVFVVPGGPFFPVSRKGRCPYIRISYSMADETELENGFRRMGEIIEQSLV